MASAPTVKEPTDSDPGDSTKWGAPDAVHVAQLLKGTHSTEKMQKAAIDGIALLETTEQTVSGVKNFKNAILKLLNPTESFSYIFKTSAISANRDVTLPALVSNDTILFENHSQAVANKTVNADQNTISNIADEEMKSHVNSKITQLTNLTNPTADQEAATKAYVDNLNQGVRWKKPVRAASTGNIDLGTASDPSPVDGVTLADGDRILLKDQSAGAENGIYDCVTAIDPTTWTRADDFDENDEVAQSAVFVKEGTLNADQAFVLTNDGAITLDTTALTFVQFSGLGQITAGDGLDKTANQLDVDSTVIRTTGAQTLDSKKLTTHKNTVNDQTAITSSTSIALDFDNPDVQTLTLSHDPSFTTSNRAKGKKKTIKIDPNGSDRTPTFSESWDWITAVPTTFTNGKTSLLVLECFGGAVGDVVAAFKEAP